MATHVQGGADFAAKRKTKQALKDLIKESPGDVYLYATSNMGSQFHAPADKLPDDMEFNVVGPDPYHDRNWYATIKRGVGGKLTCI